jgi:hypothetical protein
LGQFLAELERNRTELKQRLLNVERFIAVHPGVAYLRLEDVAARLNYQVTADSAADEARNKQVTDLLGWVRDSEDWPPLGNELPQSAIIRIQKDVRALNLALTTALARGRSRWATVNRFAARCETFDRDDIIREIESGKRKPEAVLTLAFARYLFDAGFNPLVDATACGLRPDVLDATTEPAVYVEAKQYENVSDGIVADLRKDLAQTINTWRRLSKRWRTPEAFLLVFRRSGRPIEIENPEVRHQGKRLYVLVVDLGAAEESGSRAKEPVHIDIKALLGKSTS